MRPCLWHGGGAAHLKWVHCRQGTPSLTGVGKCLHAYVCVCALRNVRYAPDACLYLHRHGSVGGMSCGTCAGACRITMGVRLSTCAFLHRVKKSDGMCGGTCGLWTGCTFQGMLPCSLAVSGCNKIFCHGESNAYSTELSERVSWHCWDAGDCHTDRFMCVLS